MDSLMDQSVLQWTVKECCMSLTVVITVFRCSLEMDSLFVHLGRKEVDRENCDGPEGVCVDADYVYVADYYQ